jgi:hypothetical protein
MKKESFLKNLALFCVFLIPAAFAIQVNIETFMDSKSMLDFDTLIKTASSNFLKVSLWLSIGLAALASLLVKQSTEERSKPYFALIWGAWFFNLLVFVYSVTGDWGTISIATLYGAEVTLSLAAGDMGVALYLSALAILSSLRSRYFASIRSLIPIVLMGIAYYWTFAIQRIKNDGETIYTDTGAKTFNFGDDFYTLRYIILATFVLYLAAFLVEKVWVKKILSELYSKFADAKKVCPSCAEKVKAQATVCRFCGQDFNQDISIETKS